jgi:hypothetical protein
MGKPLSKEQRQAWADRIHSQQASGLSIQCWCEKNAVVPHLFHYWKRRLVPNTINQSSFTELTDQKGCTIDIECQNVRIRIESPTLNLAFQALRELKC